MPFWAQLRRLASLTKCIAWFTGGNLPFPPLYSTFTRYVWLCVIAHLSWSSHTICIWSQCDWRSAPSSVLTVAWAIHWPFVHLSDPYPASLTVNRFVHCSTVKCLKWRPTAGGVTTAIHEADNWSILLASCCTDGTVCLHKVFQC